MAEQPVLPADPRTSPIAIADTRSGLRFGNQLRYNPDDLVGRKGLRIYDEMRRDEQVKACLNLKIAAVVGPGWHIEPTEETDEAQALAEEVKADIASLPGTFEECL